MLGTAFDVATDAVNSVDPALLLPTGRRDPNVNLLDPAYGTGTFLIAATSLAAERAAQEYGPAAAAAEVTAFAQRAHAFELLVGPYTVRFAFDLENEFPHVPFPADSDVFVAAARLGSRVRELETFAAAPERDFCFARLDGNPAATLAVPTRSRAFRPEGTAGRIALADDWSFVISGVSETAWSFSVSGYPILHRWLRARNGQRVDAALQREILDVVARIEELLHRFHEADPLLEQAVRMSLGRKQLTGGG